MRTKLTWPVIANLVAAAVIAGHLVGYLIPAAHAQSVMSAGDIENARGRAVVASEETHFGQAVSTTRVNAGGDSGGTGWAEATFDDGYVQSMRVFNGDAAKLLCAQVVQRASSATKCTTTCGLANTLTCTGSGAADGALIPPGGVYTEPVGGKQCLCLEASAASVNANATRVLRPAN